MLSRCTLLLSVRLLLLLLLLLLLCLLLDLLQLRQIWCRDKEGMHIALCCLVLDELSQVGLLDSCTAQAAQQVAMLSHTAKPSCCLIRQPLALLLSSSRCRLLAEVLLHLLLCQLQQ